MDRRDIREAIEIAVAMACIAFAMWCADMADWSMQARFSLYMLSLCAWVAVKFILVWRELGKQERARAENEPERHGGRAP